ncbi:Sensor histidine kinase YesM [[Clostridium] polysaccharolyticum]|uniref:Sensor histidine kinase YesM n=2 Tax=[Clostridium] polysaccharolyticum TaxID=29364 RepID=A0A1H9Y9J5_9FIRM|nr:Sensor histidine kinase YesM [[Clostridium] polysaccharolyticum]
MNCVTFLLLCAVFVEAFIWLNAFDRFLVRKFNKLYMYCLYIFGDWLIAFIRAIAVRKMSELDTVFTVVLLLYVFIFVYKFYVDSLMRKLFLVGTMFILSLCSDFIVVGVLMLCKQSVEAISSEGMLNSVATLFSKLVLYLLVILFFRKRHKIETGEFIPIIFGTILYELPSVILFNKIYLLGDNEFLLLLFVFGQIVVLCLITYAIIIINGRKKAEQELRGRIHDIEIEMNSNSIWEATMAELQHFRHDVVSHLRLMKVLLDEQKTENAKQYLNEILSERINVAALENFPGLHNRNVAIVLSQRKSYAKDKGVAFWPEIMIDDFILKDKDICTILCNILDNAVEAASKCEDGYVNIIIKPDLDTKGYFIICNNNYKEIKLRKGKYVTTKVDKEKHGLGIDIVKKVVRCYSGKCFFSSKNDEFSVEIYIPGRDVIDDKDNSL